MFKLKAFKLNIIRNTKYITLVLFVFTHQMNAKADILNITAIGAVQELEAASNRLVKDFINDMDELAERLITKGAKDGKLLLLQAGNEITLATATAASEFGDEIDSSIGDASAELKVLLAYLSRFEKKIATVDGKIEEFNDILVLDIRSMLDQIPFGSESPYVIRRINGNIIRKNENTAYYKISIRGLNFGADPAKVETKFTIKLDDKLLPSNSLDRIPPHEIILKIDAKELNDHFIADKLVTKKLSITATRLEKTIGNLPIGQKRKTAEASIEVVLLPTTAGTLEVIQTNPEYDWLPITKSDELTKTSKESFTFDHKVPSPDLDGIPKPGEMKLSRDYEISCLENKLPHRQFSNGRAYIHDDPIFTLGWYSKIKLPPLNTFTVNRTMRIAELTALSSKVKDEVNTLFGFDPKSNEFPKISKGGYLHISSDRLRSMSKSTALDVSGCNDMRSENALFSNNDSKVVIPVNGMSTSDVTWVASLQPLTYAETGEQSTSSEYFDVTTGDLLEIPVSTIVDGSLLFKFSPFYGREVEFTAENAVGEFTMESQQNLGDNKRIYYFRFNYPF